MDPRILRIKQIHQRKRSGKKRADTTGTTLKKKVRKSLPPVPPRESDSDDNDENADTTEDSVEAVPLSEDNSQNRSQGQSAVPTGDQLWNKWGSGEWTKLRVISQRHTLQLKLFVPDFRIDDPKTINDLWLALKEILGVLEPVEIKTVVSSLRMHHTYKEMVQQYRSAVLNEFKAVFKHDPYKLDGDKEKARDLLKKDQFLYLQVPADPEANQSEQIFMNANFLAVAAAFAKMPSVTRSLTVSKFLELKSFHVLACIMCFVRHQLELVIVNKSDLSSVCQSAKKYYRFMNIYNYVGDDESSLRQRGFLRTGCSRFYARMDILLNDYSGEDSDDGEIRG